MAPDFMISASKMKVIGIPLEKVTFPQLEFSKNAKNFTQENQ